jgi:disulfide bond formation protein DsbB
LSATLTDPAAGRLRPLRAETVLGLELLSLSSACVVGALIFQFAVGLAPCELCLAERWPWYAAIPLSALVAARQPPPAGRWVAPLFACLFLGSAGLAAYHVGVEQHFLAGPTACASAKLTGSVEDMTRQLMALPPVQCDVVQWSLFGVSLAGFNLLASLAALALAVLCWRKTAARRPA